MPDWIIITIFQLILLKSNIRRQLVGQQFWRLFWGFRMVYTLVTSNLRRDVRLWSCSRVQTRSSLWLSNQL